ncbi:hypothetical protein QR680_004067 [Steinernema hermaphroditum]|uniref:Uncharacterized protein n=1 Tax=Steinernema hermaphroditum TaxID=289476 RepID=A0AA39LT27_9BILA|nr:hypothetical protein QR680_004067 [Steinernema hermaphroditum]
MDNNESLITSLLETVKRQSESIEQLKARVTALERSSIQNEKRWKQKEEIKDQPLETREKNKVLKKNAEESTNGLTKRVNSQHPTRSRQVIDSGRKQTSSPRVNEGEQSSDTEDAGPQITGQDMKSLTTAFKMTSSNNHLTQPHIVPGNEFAYLSNDIIHDLLNLEFLSGAITQETSSNLLAIGGSWSEVFRSMGTCSVNFDHDGQRIVYQEADGTKNVLDANCAPVIRRTVLECSDVDELQQTVELVPNMVEYIRLTGPGCIDFLLNLPLNRFSRIEVDFQEYGFTLEDHEKKLAEDAILKQLKSRQLRSFVMKFEFSKDRQKEFDDAFYSFVKKPNFEELTSDHNVFDYRVIDAAMEEWKRKEIFSGHVQRIKLTTPLIHGTDEWHMKKRSDESDRWNTYVGLIHYHPSDPQRKSINSMHFENEGGNVTVHHDLEFTFTGPS